MDLIITDRVPTGWRIFKYADYDTGVYPEDVYRSLVQDDKWFIGKVYESVCKRHIYSIFDIEHSAPDKDCSCGYYAFKSLNNEQMIAYAEDEVARVYAHLSAYVFGKVSFWGKVVEHCDGYRAQYMRLDKVYKISDLITLRALVKNKLTTLDIKHQDEMTASWIYKSFSFCKTQLAECEDSSTVELQRIFLPKRRIGEINNGKKWRELSEVAF